MVKKNEAAGGKIVVRQNRSAIGRDKNFRRTLCALGLGRIGCKRELPDNPAVRGMIARVDCVLETSVAVK